MAAAASALFVTQAVAEPVEAVPAGIGAKPEDLSAADWGQVRARYANVLRVYGERLSAGERERILRILTTNQRMLASIRTFDVENGDTAACTLRVVDGRS